MLSVAKRVIATRLNDRRQGYALKTTVLFLAANQKPGYPKAVKNPGQARTTA